jgi:hypothetical protein
MEEQLQSQSQAAKTGDCPVCFANKSRLAVVAEFHIT